MTTLGEILSSRKKHRYAVTKYNTHATRQVTGDKTGDRVGRRVDFTDLAYFDVPKDTGDNIHESVQTSVTYMRERERDRHTLSLIHPSHTHVW